LLFRLFFLFLALRRLLALLGLSFGGRSGLLLGRLLRRLGQPVARRSRTAPGHRRENPCEPALFFAKRKERLRIRRSREGRGERDRPTLVHLRFGWNRRCWCGHLLISPVPTGIALAIPRVRRRSSNSAATFGSALLNSASTLLRARSSMASR